MPKKMKLRIIVTRSGEFAVQRLGREGVWNVVAFHNSEAAAQEHVERMLRAGEVVWEGEATG